MNRWTIGAWVAFGVVVACAASVEPEAEVPQVSAAHSTSTGRSEFVQAAVSSCKVAVATAAMKAGLTPEDMHTDAMQLLTAHLMDECALQLGITI